MESLGATPVVERGDGDDDEDIEADFETWKGKLVAALDQNDLIYKPSSLGKVTLPPSPLLAIHMWVKGSSTNPPASARWPNP